MGIPYSVPVCPHCGQPLLNATTPLSSQYAAPPPPPYAASSNRRRWTIPLVVVALAMVCLVLGTLLVINLPTLKAAVKPTPTPVPMVRMTIQLIDVACHTNESGLFPDHFYMMTTISDPDKDSKAHVHTTSQLTVPFNINGGQDEPMPSSPYTVFDGVVPQHSSIKGGFTAYDDQQGLGWGNIQQWIGEIATKVGDELINDGVDSGSWQEVAAGVIIDLAVDVWYQVAGINSSNAHKLGEKPLTFDSDGPSSEELVWNFKNSGGLFGVGSWDYTLKYQITRSIVTS